jgi:hypothetical protein
MRLLRITQDFSPVVGGIQTYACEPARQFARKGDRFLVVAASDPGYAAVDRDLPFRIHRLRSTSDGVVAAPEPRSAARWPR